MKVQKRDGRIVEYNADKITAAIKKANVEVDNSQKVSDDLIEEAIGNVEKTDKEVIPVETIQDIIEKDACCTQQVCTCEKVYDIQIPTQSFEKVEYNR